MCRLALLNDRAIHLLGRRLDVLLALLERKQGGNGNGIGTLNGSTGQIKSRKGMGFSTQSAAGELRFAVHQGATWGVFHTRWATSGGVTSRACHPFQRGNLLLAHNGHDPLCARLGKLSGKSDSAYIAHLWSKDHLPLAALRHRIGVFIGFLDGHPFVVKGQPNKDLVLAHHAATGALLFASELPDELRTHFDTCIEVGRLIWQGEPLDLSTVERRPPAPPKKIPALLPTPEHVTAAILASILSGSSVASLSPARREAFLRHDHRTSQVVGASKQS